MFGFLGAIVAKCLHFLKRYRVSSCGRAAMSTVLLLPRATLGLTTSTSVISYHAYVLYVIRT